VELKEIKLIIDLMTRNGLTEFELEKDNVKIRIKRGPGDGAEIVTFPQTQTPLIPFPGGNVANVSTTGQSGSSTQTPAAPASDLKEIKSPMVGTFYRSPSPESPSYVEIGQAVTEDTVVCIIEAMKVMNEIKAETKGVIAEVMVENGKPVEFGKPLFRVKPA
jgi:acetyl-CoA carboxylase biotin carboxyl carrier protein